MKPALLLLLAFANTCHLYAQQMAVTETGESVVLYEDGTWAYEREPVSEGLEIPVNTEVFTKPETASFLLKSKNVDVGFWLDPKVWSFKNATNNEEAEYELKLKGGDLYGMIITEKIEIPLETLRLIALENGKSIAPDLKVVKEEYRTVNGKQVLMIQMNGTAQGVKFSYYSYYLSNASGSVQFVTYTSQNLMEAYRGECEKLLNGLTQLE